MASDTEIWAMIQAERAALTDLLETLTPQQWSIRSLCGNWSVQTAAAHVLAGAEQTPLGFTRRLAATGFRFNTMIEHDARRLGALAPAEIVSRLRARVTTTNRPPAPTIAMLGEVVVHGADIRRPLGFAETHSEPATVACLEMYRTASFPVGGRKRIRGLRLVATDVEWACGDGPSVSGAAMSLMLAMTGRGADLDTLSGDGVRTLRERVGQIDTPDAP